MHTPSVHSTHTAEWMKASAKSERRENGEEREREKRRERENKQMDRIGEKERTEQCQVTHPKANISFLDCNSSKQALSSRVK